MEARNVSTASLVARLARLAYLVVAAPLMIEASHAGCGEVSGDLRASDAAPVASECAREGKRLQRQPAVAFGKTAYLVAWCDGSRQVDNPTAGIYCARIEPRTGKRLDPAGIPVCRAADLQEWPAVAFDGKNFLVVWQDFRNGRDYDVYAARVTETGKVLDPEGFPVVRRPANQARPAVAFAAGNHLVAWMDARQYPVYGLYGARVSPEGEVLDPDGRALDTEDPDRIAEVRPPAQAWLGDRHYWWERLASRYHPTMATDGKTCLVTYLRDVHSNRTTARALLVDPADGGVVAGPVALSGEPRDRLAPCAVPNGWIVAFDQWVGGWTPTPRLAALRLDASLRPLDTIPSRPADFRDASLPMLLDVQKALAPEGGLYHQGKGHFAFWQAATACFGKHVLVAMDYGWRPGRNSADLNHAIVCARFDPREGRFVESKPLVVATGETETGTSVRNPAAAAGPDGEVFLVYEKDAGVDRLTLEGCLLRSH